LSDLVTGFTDSEGDRYTIVLRSSANASGNDRAYIAAADDVAGGATSVTAQLSAPAETELYIHEYAGLASSGSFDVASANTGPTSSTTDGLTSGVATTHADNELIFGCGFTLMAKAGTGFDQRSSYNNNVTEDEIGPIAGPYQATATSTNGGPWTMMMATFRGQ
jgi:hypothetical protein